MLAGLGLTTLRRIAGKIAQKEGSDAIWSHWHSEECSDKSLREDIIKAREMSGYPVSFMRVPYEKAQRLCTGRSDGTPPIAPKWLPAMLIMHVMKHVRLRKNYKGEPALLIAYNGEFSHVTFTATGLDQRLTDSINDKLKKSLCSILKIRQVTPRNSVEIDRLINDTLSRLHPSDFPQLRALRSVPRLVVPKAVSIVSDPMHTSLAPWINPGISVSGPFRIDSKSGRVDPATVSGAQALMLDWPQGTMTVAEEHVFRSIMPKVVKPSLPSAIMRRYIRNLNDLGHGHGYNALIDSALCGSIARDDLAGSPIGNAMLNEFPFLVIFPMGWTKATTTNQGKTLLARIFGNILVQGLPITQAGRSASPPAQRAMVSPIEKFGTAAYDEYVL